MLTDRHERYPKPDGKYTFDKLSGVFTTGNATRDDAPSHIRIQQRVPRELAEAWAWMCPAGVYEVPEDAPADGTARRPDRQPLELRPVRGDHRQGRAPHAARGRRRARVPGARSATPGGPRALRGASMRRALLSPSSCSPSRRPRRPSPSRSPRARRRSIRSPAARPSRRARAPTATTACRSASRCRCARSALTGWRRVAAPGLRRVADVRRRRAPLQLRQDRREPRRARLLPHRRALPLARRGRASVARARSRRTSAACRQPDLRPNLVPRRVDVAPARHRGPAPLRRHRAQPGPERRRAVRRRPARRATGARPAARRSAWRRASSRS